MSMRYKGSRLSATANTPTSLTASGAWTLQQQMQANGTSTWPFVRDPQFNYVTMLLHGDGSAGANNGSGGGVTPTVTNFNADASTNNFNLTINGDARSDNFNPYQSGYYSNSFNGSSSYLGVSAATIAATGQFCIEAWVYQSSRSTGTDQMIFSQYTGGVSGRFYLRFNVDKLSFTTSAGDNSGATTLNTNVWYHVAVTRDASNVVRLFVNGILDLSATVTQSLQVTTPQIGAAAASSFWNGFISNLRTVSGAIPTSYQTSSTTVGTVVFTPSTSPLTTASQGASGTSLLTCQSNRFIDNSASVLTVTSTSTSIAPAQPFTLPSSVATYGSGYFDGNDYLSAPTSSAYQFGSGDFTIECWAYMTSAAQQFFFSQWNSPNRSWGFLVRNSGTTLSFVYSTTGSNETSIDGTIAAQAGRWAHFAAVRSGNTLTTYMNGVSVATASMSGVTLYSASQAVEIGRNPESGAWGFTGYMGDVRVVKGTAITPPVGGPTSPLTAVSGTSLLTTQYNGGGNNSGFKDGSQNNFVITRNGNTTQGTFTPYGSNWSNAFDATDDYLVTPSSANLALGTGDFTVEAWVNFSSLPSGGRGESQLSSTTSIPANLNSLALGASSTSSAYWQIYANDQQYNSNVPAVVGNWYHVAVVRNSGTTKLYVNGTSVISQADSKNYTQTYLIVGGFYGTAYLMDGYISNFRVVKGTAVYTSNFTPPTAPLTAITNTSLLTCQANRFFDASSNALAITVNGNPSVQRFSPFANATAYNPATTSGSAYLDGTTDYLSVANNGMLGSGNWTVELWMNAPVGQTDKPILETRNPASGTGSTGGFTLTMISSTNIRIFSGGDIINAAANYINQWIHIAIVKNGSTTTMYFNGVSAGTTTALGNMSDTTFIVGAGYYGSTSLNQYGNFYASDIRVVKGTAVYTSSFTPPPAPLTPIPSTQLLMSNTNAAILDNAMMNDLETVGNAQISTSVVKYGTASMYFDGASWDKIPNSQNFNFGSGNFTVEGWVYCTNTSPRQDIFTTPTTSGGYNGLSFGIYNGNFELTMSWTGSWDILFQTAGSVSANTWYHFAVVRNGGTLTVYINGTSTYTNTGLSTSSLVFGTDVATISYGRANQSDARYLYGYLDDFRLTKGYARYTATFTPPTQALPNG